MEPLKVIKSFLSADNRIIYPKRKTSVAGENKTQVCRYETMVKFIGESIRKQKPHHFLEWYDENTVIHPVFDKDVHGYTNKPDVAECERVLGESLEKLHALFAQVGGLETDSICIASREPRLTEKHGWKISYRFYIPTYRIKPRNLHRLIYAVGQETFWDTSIYKSENLLYIIGSDKFHDTPVLLPVNNKDNISGFLAQGVSGEENDLDQGCEKMWEVNGDPLGSKRDTPVFENENEIVTKALETLRFAGDMYSTHDRGYRFSTDPVHGRTCFLNGEKHYSNGFYVEPLENGQLLGVCLACSHGKHNSKVLGRWKESECMIEEDLYEPAAASQGLRPAQRELCSLAPPEQQEIPDEDTMLQTKIEYIFQHTYFQVEVIYKLSKLYEAAKIIVVDAEKMLKRRDKDDDHSDLTDKIQTAKGRMHMFLNALLKYFDRFFFTLNSTKVEVVEVFYDSKGRLVDYVRRSVRETNSLCANALFNNGEAFKLWWTWYKKRTFDRIVCNTDGRCGPREFNIFLGLKVDKDFDWKSYPVDESKIGRILYHIKEVLCRGDEAVYAFYLKRAKVILIDKKMSGVCAVLVGLEGGGKSCTVDTFFGNLLVGSDISGTRSRGSYCMLTNLKDLTGNFNSLSVNRLYINLNEPGTASGHVVSGALKAIITDPMTRVEQKGLDTINIRNIANLDITTNEKDCVKTTARDRRYLILNTHDKHVGDKVYFAHLHDEILAPETPAYLMKWLDATVNSSDFFKLPIPMTEEKQEMIQRSIPSPARFLTALLYGDAECVYMDKDAPKEVQRVHCNWSKVHTEEFYNCYEHWYNLQKFNNYESKLVSRIDFMRFIIKELGYTSEVLRLNNEKKRGFRFLNKHDLWERLKELKYVFGENPCQRNSPPSDLESEQAPDPDLEII